MQCMQKFKHPRLMIALALACLATVIAAAVALPLWLRRGEPLPPIPVYEDAPYTAQQIADMVYIGGFNATPTSTYQTVRVPNSRYLNIGLLPEEEYLDVYQYHAKIAPLDEASLRAFADSILPRAAATLGGSIPVYELDRTDSSGDYLMFRFPVGDLEVTLQQLNHYHYFCLGNPLERKNEPLVLNGITVQIEPTMSEEEILKTLTPTKELLFEMLGVSMPQASIRFDLLSSGIITVYYHDDAKGLCDQRGRPLGNYIEIQFDFDDYSGETLESPWARVIYRRFRDNVTERYTVINRVKRISLTDAEALLYNGYVFCIHMCPTCTSQQEKIAFNGYDHVDVEYRFGVDDKTGFLTTGVPFYVFYKRIEITANGHEVYAKAYIPAIEAREYTAYFEAQAALHPPVDN